MCSCVPDHCNTAVLRSSLATQMHKGLARLHLESHTQFRSSSVEDDESKLGKVTSRMEGLFITNYF